MAAFKFVMSQNHIFVSSTGNSNFFTLDQIEKLNNTAIVDKSVNLQRDRLGWPRRLGRHERRQHEASGARFVLPVGHDVIVLVPGPQEWLLTEELGNKVSKLHLPILGQSSLSSSRDKHMRLRSKAHSEPHYRLLGCRFQSVLLLLAC